MRKICDLLPREQLHYSGFSVESVVMHYYALGSSKYNLLKGLLENILHVELQ